MQAVEAAIRGVCARHDPLAPPKPVSADETLPFDCVPFGVGGTTVADITETMVFFDDWQSRYGYLIDLGNKMPKLPDSFRTRSRYVHGCQSQVWIDSRFNVQHQPGEPGVMEFIADSDSLIGRGLIALVLSGLNRLSPSEIAVCDMQACFQEIGLMQHLSPLRGNGLLAMVQHIRTMAAGHA